MNMTRNLLAALFLFGLLSCGTAEVKTHKSNIMDTEKQNIGSVLALYPKPMTVIGAEVNGKVNWPETDDRHRCGSERKSELACRGAYGHHRSRPDTRQHE